MKKEKFINCFGETMTRDAEPTERETITLYVEDYEKIKQVIENPTIEYDPEFFHEDLTNLIKDGDYRGAGYRLLDQQDYIDAQKIITKIEKGRKKINEKKKDTRGLNS